MNSPRVYTNIEVTETHNGFPVFYSRREGGPYYRWSYNDKSRQWQVGRVSQSDLSPKALGSATWKTIPAPLKRSINDHYQD
jgi:hypothetical protein